MNSAEESSDMNWILFRAYRIYDFIRQGSNPDRMIGESITLITILPNYNVHVP